MGAVPEKAHISVSYSRLAEMAKFLTPNPFGPDSSSNSILMMPSERFLF